jgi:predicted DNA-binding protein YlxM (UPF0122 family)
LNIEEYISSGILEAYVLDELSTKEEKKEVERMASIYPEISDEILQIQEAFNILAENGAIIPNPKLKEEIFTELNNKISNKDASSSKEKQADSSSLPPKEEPAEDQAKFIVVKESELSSQDADEDDDSEEKENNNYHSEPKRIKRKKNKDFIIAVSWIISALLITITAIAVFNWREAQQEIKRLNSENQRIAREFNLINSRFHKIAADLRLVNKESVSRIKLTGQEVTPNAFGFVYYNHVTEDVFLSVENLPTPPEGKAYQLWGISQGKAVSAGIFDFAQRNFGLKRMEKVSSASLFIITLEPSQGSKSPNREAIYLSGTL